MSLYLLLTSDADCTKLARGLYVCFKFILSAFQEIFNFGNVALERKPADGARESID